MNKILFIYSDISEKNNIALVEDVLKAVLRKFRKRVVFSYAQLDMSPSCRNAMKEVLSEKSDGILWFGKKEKTAEEEAFAEDCLGAKAKQYFSGGKCICTAFSRYSTEESEGTVSHAAQTPVQNIQLAVEVAIDFAKKRSKKILLCTDTQSPYDTRFFKEIENFLSGARSFEIDYYDFDELVYTVTKEIPSCDSILCSEDKAHLIAVNMNSLNKFPLGYTVWHCENRRIFKREFLPYEHYGNLSYASMLVAAGNMLEKELGFNSAGIHLKKAVARTLEKCFSENIDIFHRQLLFEVNAPIRNRQVNKNDSNN